MFICIYIPIFLSVYICLFPPIPLSLISCLEMHFFYEKKMNFCINNYFGVNFHWGQMSRISPTIKHNLSLSEITERQRTNQRKVEALISTLPYLLTNLR